MKLYIDKNGNKKGIIVGEVGQKELIQPDWVECQTKEDGTYATHYNLDGTIDADSEEAQEQAKLDIEAKQSKLDSLAVLTVTTSNGNTFDADDVARADMLSAITASDTLGVTEQQWKMADNSWVLITLGELKEASALAIQAKGAILSS